MLDNQHSEKKVEVLAEKAASDGSLMPLLGLAFWRMKHAFERDVGLRCGDVVPADYAHRGGRDKPRRG